MFSANGYEFAEIDHEITELAGGPKTVQLTFNMEQGPKVQVEEIEFVGNDNIDDGELKGQMEHIKERWFLSWITGRGTYKAALFEEDADAITAHYLANGYIDANVGSPETDLPGGVGGWWSPAGCGCAFPSTRESDTAWDVSASTATTVSTTTG